MLQLVDLSNNTNFNCALETARNIAANVRFGCSSWVYPGWRNVIYKRTYGTEKEFKATCLAEYSRIGLFRTVGIDSFFYSAPSEKTLKSYAEQTPEDFKWVSKVWERITIPKFPSHPRYGKIAGQNNPDFLNADIFKDQILARYLSARVENHMGPFVFQFPTIYKTLMNSTTFLDKLDAFLKCLPPSFQYSTEIRNKEFLTQNYFDVLNSHSVTHCFNHWQLMPPLKFQMQRAAEAGGLKANFYVARLLTPLGVSYENAVKMFSPYERTQQENLEARQDAARIAKRAIAKKIDAYIIVNNRLEGNAPNTIAAIQSMLTEE